MQFNIGLDLNKSHNEMKHNAFPKAKNVILNDYGNAIITEYGMTAISDYFLFNKGTVLKYYNEGSLIQGVRYTIKLYKGTDDFSNCVDTGSGIGTINTTGYSFIANGNTPTNWSNGSTLSQSYSNIFFNAVNLTICGIIPLESNLLLFIYDDITKLSFIVKLELNINPFTGKNDYSIYLLRNTDGTYYSFSFDNSSIIKGTYYYNYLNQLIIAYNDVSKLKLPNRYSNKFKPTSWICNLDEAYPTEDNKLKSTILNSTTILGQLYTVINDSASNLQEGYYSIAYISVDKNGNESELSAFVSIYTFPFGKIDNYLENARYNTIKNKSVIQCTVTESTNYKLLIAYKGTTSENTLYYKTPVISGTCIISNLNTLESTNIIEYLPKLLINKVGAIEQYDNKLLLGNVSVLDESYTYYDEYTEKSLSLELQKVSNNIYFTSVGTINQSEYTDVSEKFAGDEVYAMYIEYISIYGTSLGTYHIPGRESIDTEIVSAESTYMTGIYVKGNINPANCVDGNGNNVIGVFINKNEFYPSTFPSTKLRIYNSDTLGIGSNLTLAGTRVRHHRMIGQNQVCDLVARNIIIPSQLKYIVGSYRIYYAKRNNINNLLLNTCIHDAITTPLGQLYYFNSFDALFDRENINCAAVRKLGNFIPRTYAPMGEVLTSQYQNNWINNSCYKFDVLEFIDAGTSALSQVANKQIIKQSYFYNILGSALYQNAAFGPGIYSIYSNNITNNCYTDYINQKLVLAGYTVNNSDTTLILKGDTFCANEGYGINGGYSDTLVGHRKIYFPILPSKKRAIYRYKLQEFNITPEKQRYFPVDNITDITNSLITYDNPINTDLGVFYKSCFNSLNDNYQPIVFDFTKTFVSNLQNRIYRTETIGTESTVIGWKNITGLDYYDLPKNKGKIITMVLDVKKLYIQCEHGLFLDSINDTLNANINVLPLDIFEYKPIELNMNNPIKSYNPFSLCNSPIGIIAISNDTSIYIIGQGIEEISINGIQNYMTPKYNTIVNHKFVHVAVDIQTKRILFNNPDKNVTLSYNYIHKCFVAEHDYSPKFAVNCNNNIYFVNILDNNRATKVYKFDKTSTLYVDRITRISSLDMVFNSYPDITKLLQSINWITKSIRIDGSEDEYNTFSTLMVYNNTQCSDYINLRNGQNSDNSRFDWFDTDRSIKVYDGFYYNNIFDKVLYQSQPFLDSNLEPINTQFPIKSWDNLSNFISNYFVIRFQYYGSNKLIITDIIPELIKTAR